MYCLGVAQSKRIRHFFFQPTSSSVPLFFSTPYSPHTHFEVAAAQNPFPAATQSTFSPSAIDTVHIPLLDHESNGLNEIGTVQRLSEARGLWLTQR